MTMTLRIAQIALLLVCEIVSSHADASRNDREQSRAHEHETNARTHQLHQIFQDYWNEYLKQSPETATAIGDKRYNDRWSDLSETGRRANLHALSAIADRIKELDLSEFDAQDKLSAALLVRSVREAEESERFKEWQMPIDQIHGIHIDIPQLVASIPFDSGDDYENYLHRLRAIPLLFSQLENNLRQGLIEKRVETRLVIEKVIEQIQSLVSTPSASNPFSAPLAKLPGKLNPNESQRLKERIEQSIAQDVLPSYRHLAAFLQSDYLPKAREQIGIWAIPDGDAYYAFCIRRSTTLALSAAEIHQMGIEAVENDRDAMLAIAGKLGYSDIHAFSNAMKSNARLHATSREEVLEDYRRVLATMQPKLPTLFGVLPKARFVVEATPLYAEKQRPAASYDPAAADGSRPGRITVNTYNVAEIPLENVEAIAYHEGIPGHHLQFSIAQELPDLPEFRKHQEYVAYTEGWGLYAEQLGKEVGLFTDPYSDYGRLESDDWRSIRLVVDTGIHALHWNRQQVVDYFREHSSVDETNIQRETDRYIAWPGQALGYKVGQLRLIQMRHKAQTRLGDRFDIRKFHDFVLGSAALPLDILDSRLDEWIASTIRNDNKTGEMP